jgi:hypothetical protein
MKKTIFILFALSVFMFAFAQKSFACSCVLSKESVKKQIKTAYQGSTAVFEAEVLEVRESGENDFRIFVKVRVSKSWKGGKSGEMIITTPSEGSLCGYDFAVGKSYLVYANGTDNQLSVFLCSRTGDLLNNGDLKYLSKLKPKKTGKNKLQK